jgi:hypothetical protein
MKSTLRVFLALPVVAILMFAQNTSSQTPRKSGQSDQAAQTIRGTVLDATCSSATALSPTATDSKARTAAKKEALRQCQPTTATSSYALLTGDGHFYRLDESGNREVAKITSGKNSKNMRVSATGSVDGDVLKVQSLSKM